MAPLLAVPNVSEGRDAATIARLERAFAQGARLLDRHSDPDHNRSVFTLAGAPGELERALVAGARAALREIDMDAHEGQHPCVGALDVAPVVWLEEAQRAEAREAALRVARELGRLGLPVFLYGELARTPARRERAFFRAGGLAELRRRMASGELHPDFGPSEPHPSGGATLVTARPPLAAFNLELSGAGVAAARAIAAELREAGGGLPGVRAIGLELAGGVAQVSTNVHDPIAVPLARVVERTEELARRHGARVARAEIVGLVPRAALAGFPEKLEVRGLAGGSPVIEERLEAAGRGHGRPAPG
jgi:glutamate formiminotransferase